MVYPCLPASSHIYRAVYSFFISTPLTVYVSTWGRFVQLQVNEAGLELRYAGSWQLPVRVPRDQVQTVLVGWGKPGRPCYLRVVLRDGSSHRSAELPAPASQCRVLQAQVLGAL